MKNKKDFIRSADMFMHFAERDIEKLAYKAEVINFAKHSMIYLSGDEAKYIYLTISGWVKIFTTSFNGDETVLGVIGKGRTFGDTASLGKVEYLVSTQAITPVKVIKIPYSEYLDVLKGNDKALDFVFNLSAERQKFLIKEIEQLITCTANERIGIFLLRMLKNKEVITHEDNDSVTIKLPYAKSVVAAQLGMQAETFSRAFAKLKKDGLIKSSQRNITINSISQLKQFCRVDGPI